MKEFAITLMEDVPNIKIRNRAEMEEGEEQVAFEEEEEEVNYYFYNSPNKKM